MVVVVVVLGDFFRLGAILSEVLDQRPKMLLCVSRNSLLGGLISFRFSHPGSLHAKEEHRDKPPLLHEEIPSEE